MYFLTVLEAGSPRSRCQRGWVLLRPRSLAFRQPFSCCAFTPSFLCLQTEDTEMETKRCGSRKVSPHFQGKGISLPFCRVKCWRMCGYSVYHLVGAFFFVMHPAQETERWKSFASFRKFLAIISSVLLYSTFSSWTLVRHIPNYFLSVNFLHSFSVLVCGELLAISLCFSSGSLILASIKSSVGSLFDFKITFFISRSPACSSVPVSSSQSILMVFHCWPVFLTQSLISLRICYIITLHLQCSIRIWYS